MHMVKKNLIAYIAYAALFFFCLGNIPAYADGLAGLFNLGDSMYDITAIDPNSSRIVTWFSDPVIKNTFQGGQELFNGQTKKYQKYYFLTADLDGDLRWEIIGISPDRTRYVIWFKKKPYFLPPVEGTLSGYSCSTCVFVVADVNNDGRQDLIGIDRKQELFITYKSFGGGYEPGFVAYDGTYSLAKDKTGWDILIGTDGISLETYKKPGTYYLMYAGNCAGDSNVDILAFLQKYERAICYPGIGDGRFSKAVEMMNDLHDYGKFRILVGDITGDKRVDIVAIRPDTSAGGDVVWWINAGSKFKTGVSVKWPGVVTANYIFQLKDVDGDGKADLVAISPSETKFIVYRSYGNGLVGPSVWLDEPLNYGGYRF